MSIIEQREYLHNQCIHYEKNNMGNSPEWRYNKLQIDILDVRIENEELRQEIVELKELMKQTNITIELLANATRPTWHKINIPSPVDINK